jgi:hypothetical protein
MNKALGIDAHHDALNSHDASKQSLVATRLEGSIEKTHPPLTPRRKQTAKAIIRRKGIVRAATV